MIIITGPYIGDFEQEIITFRPYVKWLSEVINFEKMYVNTHYNRFFLYDFIDKSNIIPCNEYISRDEEGQTGYIHKEATSKDYQIFVKEIKDEVSKREDKNKKDLIIENLPYVKSLPPIPYAKKVFEPINVDIENKYADKIIFIPANTEKKERLCKVKEFLKESDFVIAGDKKTRFKKDNVVLSKIDYFENGFKLLVKMISEAKAVVCPLSFWTTICNLQGVPVFSWGDNVNQHKENGIYNFGNKKCLALAVTEIKVVLNMLEYFLEEVYNG